MRPSEHSKRRLSILNYTLVSFVAVGIMSVFLIFLDHRTGWLDETHAFLLEKSSPVTQSVEKFSRGLHNAHAYLDTLFSIPGLLKEKQRYQGEKAYWQNKALSLERENVELRKLTKFVADHPQIKLTTDLLTYPHLPFSHRFTIRGGSKNGVKINDPVISHRGVIGRISKVNKNSAEVLLLTDATSRVPVYIETTNEHAILAGSHTGEVSIFLRQKDSQALAGSRIVTSGKGGVFSPGLFVGYISKQDPDAVTLANKDLSSIGKVFVLEGADVNN